MAFWIGVVHRQQVLIAADEGFVSFSHGRESTLKTVVPGDRVIYYAPRSKPGGPPVQAFVAHATVTGDDMELRDFGGRPGHTRRAVYDDVTEVPVRPMLDDLDITRGAANWGGVFRGGKIGLGEADYRTIASSMGVHLE